MLISLMPLLRREWVQNASGSASFEPFLVSIRDTRKCFESYIRYFSNLIHKSSINFEDGRTHKEQ